MKYIKTYEKYYSGEFWILPTDTERAEDAVKKICDDKFYCEFLLNILQNYNSNNEKFIYINKSNDLYGFNGYDYGSLEYYKKHNYKYMGAIDIEQWELDTYKYNL